MTTLDVIKEMTQRYQESSEGEFDGYLSAGLIANEIHGAETQKSSPEYKAVLGDIRALIENGQVQQKKLKTGLVYKLVSDTPVEEAKPKTKAKAKPKTKKAPKEKAPKHPVAPKEPEKLKRKVRKTLQFNTEGDQINLSSTVLETVKAICEQIPEGATIDTLAQALEQQGFEIDDSYKGRGAEKRGENWVTSRAKLSSQLAWHKSNEGMNGPRGRYVYIDRPEDSKSEVPADEAAE